MNPELRLPRSPLQSTCAAMTGFCLFLVASPRKKLPAHPSRHRRRNNHLVVQIAAKFYWESSGDHRAKKHDHALMRNHEASDSDILCHHMKIPRRLPTHAPQAVVGWVVQRKLDRLGKWAMACDQNRMKPAKPIAQILDGSTAIVLFRQMAMPFGG